MKVVISNIYTLHYTVIIIVNAACLHYPAYSEEFEQKSSLQFEQLGRSKISNAKSHLYNHFCITQAVCVAMYTLSVHTWIWATLIVLYTGLL